MHKTISQEDFKKMFESNQYELIDLRTASELEQYGVISENQLHIDVSKPDAAERIWLLKKDKKYLIYCWHWVRSKQVLEYMKTLWFSEVYDLEGWIDTWN